MNSAETNLLMSIALLAIMIGVLVFITVRVFRNDKESRQALERINNEPENIQALELVDEDRLYVIVTFRGEKPIHTSTLRGLGAVRLYDRLAEIAPQATRKVSRGGQEVVL